MTIKSTDLIKTPCDLHQWFLEKLKYTKHGDMPSLKILSMRNGVLASSDVWAEFLTSPYQGYVTYKGKKFRVCTEYVCEDKVIRFYLKTNLEEVLGDNV